MRLEYQILIAVALDLVLGDPRWLPHPVRGIGRLALGLEALSRRVLGSTRIAGLVAALATYVAGRAGDVGSDSSGGRGAIRWPADVVSIVVIYTTIAARDLARHSMAVFRPLGGRRPGRGPATRRRDRRPRHASGSTKRAWSGRPWKAWPRAPWTA